MMARHLFVQPWVGVKDGGRYIEERAPNSSQIPGGGVLAGDLDRLNRGAHSHAQLVVQRLVEWPQGGSRDWRREGGEGVAAGGAKEVGMGHPSGEQRGEQLGDGDVGGGGGGGGG